MNYAIDLWLLAHVPGFIALGKLLAGVWFATTLLYALYLSYCTLRVMRDSGRLAKQPALARAHGWIVLGAALTLDVAFNFVIGSMLFLESPDVRRPTFTARCKKWLDDDGYRGRIARWVCEGWLNPGEPGHC